METSTYRETNRPKVPRHTPRIRPESDAGALKYDENLHPANKAAPARTGWIYLHGENFPRLTTLYVKTTEWRRWEREGRI